MTTLLPSSYSTVLKMTIRFGVAMREDMEDMRVKVLDLSSCTARSMFLRL